ncbi:MAG: glycosyltransferase [Gemmatimonadaceae bacterium]
MSAGSALPMVLHLDTERGWRGGERQVLWLAEGLARAGIASAIAARPGEPLAERAAAAGIAVVPCAPAFEGDPFAVRRLRRAIRDLGVGIVHAHTGHTVSLGALATLGMRIPLVVARRVDFRLRDNVGTRWKYHRAAAVIAISHAVADVVARSGIPRGRLHVVPDGADRRRQIHPASDATLGALGVPAGAPLVVQVSQLVGHKDPVTFARAVARARRRVPALHALLVGDGPLRVAVEAARHELGLEDRLHVTGYRTDADALLARADVVTLSSKEEGMGSVLLDALHLGKPIAATAAGGIPEVIEDGVSGLLAPVGNADALGGRIADLLTDRALAQRLAAGAAARADQFSVDRMVERTIAVYRQVIGTAN